MASSVSGKQDFCEDRSDCSLAIPSSTLPTLAKYGRIGCGVCPKVLRGVVIVEALTPKSFRLSLAFVKCPDRNVSEPNLRIVGLTATKLPGLTEVPLRNRGCFA